jgi:hypothetical protein
MELVLSSSSEQKNLSISIPKWLYIFPHNISVRNSLSTNSNQMLNSLLFRQLAFQRQILVHKKRQSTWTIKYISGVRKESSYKNLICMFFFAPCNVILLYNLNQQNAPFLNYFLIFMMYSTCFETEGLSSGRSLYVQVGYILHSCDRAS